MRICIFSPEEEFCKGLALGSQGAGYQVEQTFSEPRELEEFISCSNIDFIVLIDVRREREPSLQLIKDLCAGGPQAMVALGNAADSLSCAQAMKAGAQALLVNPVSPSDIRAAFTVAAHQQARQALLESEIVYLREKLADRKLIEKAKGILMDSAKVTEAEAFRLIQKQSQDKRKPMSEIAMLIISATELVREAKRASAE